MPSFIQSNTQQGLIVRNPLPSVDFTNAEGLLAKISSSSGNTIGLQYVDLAGVGDIPLYVVTEVEVATGEAQRVTLQPLMNNRNVRGIASAAINAGVQVASAAGGQLRAATTGDYVIGITEDAVSASGQYVLFRPAFVGGTHA